MSTTLNKPLLSWFFFCFLCCLAPAQQPPGPGAAQPRGGTGLISRLAELIMAKADADQDERLAAQELTHLAASWFEQFDASEKGVLSEGELSAGLDELLSPAPGAQGQRGRGRRFSPATFVASGLFSAMNANQDNGLTKDAFTESFAKWFSVWDPQNEGTINSDQLTAGLQAVLPRRRSRGGAFRRAPTPDDLAGFTPIFDGQSLEGWEGEPGFWRVEDGAIVGETTVEKQLESNTFLIWRDGETANFELKLEYRLGETGNSGIQYRSSQVPEVSRWTLRGYQADIDAANRFTGMIYEERGRGFLAPRSQFSRITADGTTKLVGTVGESQVLGGVIKSNDWNHVHVIADGKVLMQLVNGRLMSVVVDEDRRGHSSSGLLGLQLHVGPPMRIEFRKIMIKHLVTASRGANVERPQGDKAAVGAALERLSRQRGYRWTTVQEGGGFFPGIRDATSLEGATEASGLTRVVSTELSFVRKSDSAAVELEGNWMTVDQARQRSGGRRGFGRSGGLNVNSVTDFQLPLVVARDYLESATGFEREGDTVTARLSGEAVSQALAPRSRRRRGPTQLRNPEGTVTFQLTNSELTKVTVALQGAIDFRGEERQLDRVTTISIEQLSSEGVKVPADASEIVEALRAGRTPNVFVPEPGFRKLFNGHDLSGWDGQPEYWSVRDRSIVGKTTRETPAHGNTFLIARDGDKDLIVDDFELRLRYRIVPNNDRGFANSGIQYRSKSLGNYVAAGYQADFEAGEQYSGILYDEAGGAGGRRIMAAQGQSVEWTEDGEQRVTGQIASREEIQAAVKQDDWNEYTIIARGSRLQHFINGVQTVDVADGTTGKRLDSGILGLQLHAGEPMTVEFKDIRIKSLSSVENVAASNITVAEDFKLELLYMVPKDSEGSWVASCLDDRGRMIVSDQNGKLYRFDLPAPGTAPRVQPEPIELEIGGAHGLLYAFDSLYVMVNEGELTHGFYRVEDTDGDDHFDEVRLLKAIDGSGEHGLHAILPAPDGESLIVVCGDATQIFDTDASRVPLHWGEDHLLPKLETGFMAGVLAPGGFIARTDPNGANWELIANGFRNQFDAAFNRDGELFTFDADMEWDIGDPWYRPTRVNHVISGAEFGWRSGAGKWPDYYLDSFGAVVNTGPGSPTGVTFGYGTRFPAKYQDALYIADWSFGKLYAVHLKARGASYEGELEEFITGQPLPLTDVIINPHDGAMYLTVGGRQTQSALYRVTYHGTESTAPSAGQSAFQSERDARRRLESFHGRQSPEAVDAAWPYLRSQDRALRFAARIALEWQDPQTWRARALAERYPRTAIAALAGLARTSGRDEPHRGPDDPAPDPFLRQQMLVALGRIEWATLSDSDRVDLLRTFTLVFTRLGSPRAAARLELIDRFDPLFPAATPAQNALLANLMIYLEAPSAATKTMELLRNASTQEEQIEYALALRVLKTGWTPSLREEYFRWFVETATTYRGGNTFATSLQTIKENATETLNEQELAALRPILEATPVRKSPQELLAERQFVKRWSLDELVSLVESDLGDERDLDRGRQVFGAVACASCHRFDQAGGLAGPELTGVSGRFTVRDLLEAIVDPNKVISDQYAAINIVTKDGRVITGRVGNLFGDSISVVENMLSPGDLTSVRRQDIESMHPAKVSVMPADLLNTLQAAEIQDLMAYLLSGGDSRRAAFE